VNNEGPAVYDRWILGGKERYNVSQTQL